jgi:plastocyanin
LHILTSWESVEGAVYEIVAGPGGNDWFQPSRLEIHLGDTVRWTLSEGNSKTYTSTCESGACPEEWEGEISPASPTFEVTPTQLGEHLYYSQIYGQLVPGLGAFGMYGRIIVLPPGINRNFHV